MVLANHKILCQVHFFGGKHEQLQGYLPPNDTCKCLQIAAEAFQYQIRFMVNVQKAWEGNRTWLLHQNIPLEAYVREK